MLGTVKRGIDFELEDRATAMLSKDRRDRGLTTTRSTLEEYCWLSNGQLEYRQEREVYTSKGMPDASLKEGRVFRAYNPLFGTRPGRYRPSD